MWDADEVWTAQATSRSSRRLTTTARARSLSSSTVASTSAVSSREYYDLPLELLDPEQG